MRRLGSGLLPRLPQRTFLPPQGWQEPRPPAKKPEKSPALPNKSRPTRKGKAAGKGKAAAKKPEEEPIKGKAAGKGKAARKAVAKPRATVKVKAARKAVARLMRRPAASA